MGRGGRLTSNLKFKTENIYSKSDPKIASLQCDIYCKSDWRKCEVDADKNKPKGLE